MMVPLAFFTSSNTTPDILKLVSHRPQRIVQAGVDVRVGVDLVSAEELALKALKPAAACSGASPRRPADRRYPNRAAT